MNMKLRLITFFVVLFVFFCIFCFAVGELFVRVVGHYDIDGNFYIRNRVLKPYHLPVHSLKQEIDEYLRTDDAFIVFDSLLGWRPKPNSVSQDKNYRYNSAAIRSEPREYSRHPEKDVLRIALLGNSFTHSSEVDFRSSWGVQLEQELLQKDVKAEVLNFGVAGYGIDQVFLRWQLEGKYFEPDIVILGFAPVDVKRNVNVIRTVLSPTLGFPFTKPRFILQQNELRVINRPTPAPERIPRLMQNIEKWPYTKYEYFFDPDDYTKTILQHSKLFSLIQNFVELNRFNVDRKNAEKLQQLYDLRREPAQVTEAIIDEFAHEVRQTGAKFMIVHLPDQIGLNILLRGDTLQYNALLQKIERGQPLLQTENDFAKVLGQQSLADLFEAGGHYSQAGNAVVAAVVARVIIVQIRK